MRLKLPSKLPRRTVIEGPSKIHRNHASMGFSRPPISFNRAPCSMAIGSHRIGCSMGILAEADGRAACGGAAETPLPSALADLAVAKPCQVYHCHDT